VRKRDVSHNDDEDMTREPETVRSELVVLFTESDAHKRGKALEGAYVYRTRFCCVNENCGMVVCLAELLRYLSDFYSRC
jgi:hypothetical protein